MLGIVCAAVAAFAAFLALCVLVEGFWPNFEKSRYFEWSFGPTFVLLVVIELALYVHLQAVQAKLAFFAIHAGKCLVVCTARKGWYPLLRELSASNPCARVEYVWWRQRSSSPIAQFELTKPPVDLPFVVVVEPSHAACIALGPSLRQFRRGSPRQHIGTAHAALVELWWANDRGTA
jgi:hypothetical protein